ncbi:YegS/Rv2252/BmrU family lipid kinase [Leucobacter insecticola]|uniref:YegS/Rv2252/BmrU family lipid kinase n=1 Tax=Leucobacter insecticola TaxID=2714934 RepID=A0A6G8FI56_9MICO|nr:YegS/Rv2252/BmrU family lipid kinase [Leucobacter insecticola]QIM15969.1 YegS/Rv2252/BmrU family lipid kinase [Leucobacter insecticola]
MTPHGHIAVLSNPFAGKGRGRTAAAAAIAELRARGVEVRAYAGASAADTVALAAQALRDDPALLVVVGGDGTMSEVLESVLGSAVPLALVPAGTGNDLARTLGIPRTDPADAAALAVTGTIRDLDVGELQCSGRVKHFLTIAALGFDAKVSDRTNRLRWPSGSLRYYLALVIELLRLSPLAFKVQIDDEPERAEPGTLIAIGNTVSYGGGMPICAGADPSDGFFDVVHVAPMRRWELIRLFPKLLRGQHLELPQVSQRRVHKVGVSAPGLSIYADGEFVGTDTCAITVLPARLKMMVPHATAEEDRS